MKQHLLAPVAVAVLALSLTACGGDDTSAADTSQFASGTSGRGGSAPSGAPEGAGADGMGLPGASGEVAAVQGEVVQVQGTQGQVAVTLSDSTAITTQVASTLTELEVGSCVVVVGAATEDSDESGPAASVRISDPVDGECTGDFGGGPGGGQRPSGAPSDMPSDLPSDMPNDGAGGPGGRAGLVVGAVTAVDDAGFTVASVAMGATGDPSDEPQTPLETTEVVVEVDDATAFTSSVEGEAADVKVGRCLTAQGETDDTGAVTADSVSVSDKVDGECSAGFGGRGGPGGMPGADDSGDEAAS